MFLTNDGGVSVHAQSYYVGIIFRTLIICHLSGKEKTNGVDDKTSDIIKLKSKKVVCRSNAFDVIMATICLHLGKKV